MPHASNASTSLAPRSAWPALICWFAVFLDGFDLVALGAIIPDLLDGEVLGFTSSSVTTVSTMSLVGVALGASLVGVIAARIGRRKLLVAATALFSLFTLLTAFAPSVELFGIYRFIAGIGLGACLPSALVIISEHMPAEKRSRANTYTMTGYHVGAVAASLVALSFSPNWHIPFLIGGLLGLVAVPLMWFGLEDDMAPKPARATLVEAETAPQQRKESIFSGRWRAITIAVWVGSFMGLLLVYGLNTWLPQLMRVAGYDVSDSIVMLFVLNVGAVTGLVLAGQVADRAGIRRTAKLWFAMGTIFLALLSLQVPNAWLLNAMIFITGVFVFSSQVLIYAYINTTYPDSARPTAMGMAASVGRFGAIVGPLVTGALVTAGIAYPWGFYFFAAIGLLGLIAVWIVPNERKVRAEVEAENGRRTIDA
ncbi:MAG TPA: aromatic acid/H+ symport family MFS transporter [Dietzia timorensis]|uniref:Aromatic acid/H+ symport family MFS transporter n=1 Tax=Dietzia timorensis TaxID=499555 RepID=A0A921JZ05_9ACTN|nr:aromatic acid/H+ symport family MFS transporter [Dietzia timorensis]HJE90441.1 aromatic acid/H+ symport family MFS transporter [Dietzia timorensis]